MFALERAAELRAVDNDAIDSCARRTMWISRGRDEGRLGSQTKRKSEEKRKDAFQRTRATR